mgnify:CR=1 FL=1|jgi:hypothetical protein
MRRPRSPERVVSRAGAFLRRAVALGLTAAFLARPSWGQEVKEGAPFLLIPVGARAVGQGQAVVASRLGPEAIWWNPASLAWLTKRTAGIDHGQNFIVTSDALDAVLPAGRAGVLGAGVEFLNFGDQAASDQFGNTIGTLYSHALVGAVSYAATFGRRISAGVTYKYVQQSQSCGGSCQNLLTYSVSTSAFDVGAQAVVGDSGAVTLGLALRNAGFGLQTIDAEQTDPLPTRLHVGADLRVDAVARAVPGASLHLSTELVLPTGSTSGQWIRAGGELGYADRFFLRAGAFTGSTDGSSAVVGIGVRQGLLSFDFSRAFGGLSTDAGSPPTYLTLRVAFR